MKKQTLACTFQMVSNVKEPSEDIDDMVDLFALASGKHHKPDRVLMRGRSAIDNFYLSTPIKIW